MKDVKNNRGQAMVEAMGTLWILFLVFGSLYYLFLMSIDKIRSLDTAYHMARAHEVKKDDGVSTVSIMSLCFGRSGLKQINHLSPVDGVAMDEVIFQFLPRSPRTITLPWKSVMRVVSPRLYFLDKSWPGAQTDTFSGLNWAGERLLVQAQVAANQDAVVDATEEVIDILKAE